MDRDLKLVILMVFTFLGWIWLGSYIYSLIPPNVWYRFPTFMSLLMGCPVLLVIEFFCFGDSDE